MYWKPSPSPRLFVHGLSLCAERLIRDDAGQAVRLQPVREQCIQHEMVIRWAGQVET
jgi:hypothetical protein